MMTVVTGGGGQAIFFEAEGSGEPLVMSHGFTGTGRRWTSARYLDALVDRYQVITPDARGHGRSAKPREVDAYRYQRHVDDVLAVVDSLGIDRFHYFGYSMGGRVGYALAAAAPERLLTLTIGAATPFPSSGTLPSFTTGRSVRLAGIGPDAPRRVLPLRLVQQLVLSPAARWYWRRHRNNDVDALAALAQAHRTEDLTAAMEHSELPTLMFVGDQDILAGRVLEAAERMPHAQLEVMVGHDHKTAVNARDEVLSFVLPFLQANAIRGAAMTQ